MILKESFNNYSLKADDTSDLVFLMIEHLPYWLTVSCLNIFPRAFLAFFCPSALWGKWVREGVEGLEAHQRSRGEVKGEVREKDLKGRDGGQQARHSSTLRQRQISINLRLTCWKDQDEERTSEKRSEKNSEKYHVGGCGGSTQQSGMERPHSRVPGSHVLVEMHEAFIIT